MKTKKEVNGYQYSHGSGGKKWKRGRVMFSEGKRWISINEYVPIIAKTNLDTGEITEANLKEAKRFLTDEGYAEYVAQRENCSQILTKHTCV